MFIGGNVFVHRSEIVSFDELKGMLTVDNPEFVTNTRFGSEYSSKPDAKICFLKEHDGQMFECPRNMPSILFCPKTVVDLRSQGEPTNFSKADYLFSGKLREYQKNYLKTLDEGSDFVMQAQCGTGKTLLSLYLLSHLKVRAVVIVPTLYLAKQWSKRVADFLPNVNCVVGKSAIDYEGADVYILNIDRLKAKDYDEKFYAYWGCLIMDEGHRYGASTYQPEVGAFPAFYRMCLTATFRRADGMHRILSYHFGKVCSMDDPFPKARIIPLLTGVKVDTNDFIKRGKLNYPLLDNWIAVNGYRNKMLMALTFSLIEEGRTVLFLSKRREPLEIFHQMALNRGYRSVLIVGGISDAKQEELYIQANESQLIFGISQLAKEGMDIEHVDTLILHHPVKDIEQPLGRIRRIKEGKKEPLCIYPIDEIAPYNSMFMACKRTANGAKIEDFITYEKLINARRTLRLERVSITPTL